MSILSSQKQEFSIFLKIVNLRVFDKSMHCMELILTDLPKPIMRDKFELAVTGKLPKVNTCVVKLCINVNYLLCYTYFYRRVNSGFNDNNFE